VFTKCRHLYSTLGVASISVAVQLYIILLSTTISIAGRSKSDKECKHVNCASFLTESIEVSFPPNVLYVIP